MREEAEADGRWRRRLKRSSTAVVAVAEALAFASWMPEVVGTFAWLAAEVEGMALGEEGGADGWVGKEKCVGKCVEGGRFRL